MNHKHTWIVTAWYKAIDEFAGGTGLRASKLICPDCGVERALNIMAGLAKPIQDKKQL
jgi:hypothetical protein